MSCEEKCCLMNDLVEPFGYVYLPQEDIFSTRTDAWQRELGYCALYDKTAYRFHLIFDCLPVYFDYCGRTWLIEVWKGQYGINTGGEFGVYRAGHTVSREDRKKTVFHSVPDEEMPELAFKLYQKGRLIADISARHWWLTAFLMGCFSRPKDLCMRACITFPDPEMAELFAKGLWEAGYRNEEICLCCRSVTFLFTRPAKRPGCFRRLYTVYAQWLNRLLCRLYLFVTRPFCTSLDRLLYLYFYLPRSFGRMLRLRKNRKFKYRRRRRR